LQIIHKYLQESAARRVTFLLKGVAAISITLLAAGCSTTLEDGYKPRALDAGPEARKSFYASPFTDSAEAGGKDIGPALHAGH
jgi:hypothetical protein